MKTNKTLEQQLIIAEKEKNQAEKRVSEIQKKLKKIESAKKPKSIFDRVKTLQDVLKIAKPTKEELAIINYKGRSKRLVFMKNVLIVSLISEVLNEGWTPKMDGSEYRYYAWFYLNSSGFVFNFTLCDVTYAYTSSASRLCLKNQETAKYSATQFLKYHQAMICG